MISLVIKLGRARIALDGESRDAGRIGQASSVVAADGEWGG
jgi:hypothetical protein